MRERIAGFLSSRKGRDVVLASSMLILACTSFGLGRLSTSATPNPSVSLVVSERYVATTTSQSTVQSPEQGQTLEVEQGQGGTGQYVASKKGQVYHLPWCSGAKRISEENKVWFATKQDAEQAGYRPASNCKGM